MPERILFPEWRDENALSRYPFEDGASLKSRSGFTFPVDLFIDLRLYLNEPVEYAYLRSVQRSLAGVRFEFATSAQEHYALAQREFSDNRTEVEIKDRYQRHAGLIVLNQDRFVELQGWPEGEHMFAREASRLCALCLVPIGTGYLEGIALETGEVLSGEIWLVGEDGVVLRTESVSTDPDGESVVRIDIVGDPLFRRKACEDEEGSFQTPRLLRSINNVPPDNYGQIHILAGAENVPDSILAIDTLEDGLRIRLIGPGGGEGE